MKGSLKKNQAEELKSHEMKDEGDGWRMRVGGIDAKFQVLQLNPTLRGGGHYGPLINFNLLTLIQWY